MKRIAKRKATTVATEAADTRAPVPLEAWVSVRRRYTRSINLERDLLDPSTVEGYVLTPRAADSLQRVLTSVREGTRSRAFTLTGIYGTGKSAFAHFLSAICAPSKDDLHKSALRQLVTQIGSSRTLEAAVRLIPKQGMVRAVATARRESLSVCVIRAIRNGLAAVSSSAPLRRALGRCDTLLKLASRGARIDDGQVVALLNEASVATRSPILLVLDELGKALEHVAMSGGTEDLFLLQRLAETPRLTAGGTLVVVGLLHQNFSEYSVSVTPGARSEWQKIQGRFEDVPFLDSPQQMLGLLRHAVVHTPDASGSSALGQCGLAWHERIAAGDQDHYVVATLTRELTRSLLPLHPIAALALPALCAKYAQHDRSLFSFLTSNEPNAFSRFLREHVVSGSDIPVLRLEALYDYFIDVAGHGLTFRPQFQRWSEIHSVISDARGLSREEVAALKTVGVLNLLATAGSLRASRALVLLALSTAPDSKPEQKSWRTVLDALVAKGLLTYRSRLDEYRVWEGSEFDVEAILNDVRNEDAGSLIALLRDNAPTTPAVAQRHSYETGTLRYYEIAYADDSTLLESATCIRSDSDGLILKWVGTTKPRNVPAHIKDGRPLVVVAARDTVSLTACARELTALRKAARSPQLQADGVARREMTARLNVAEVELARAVVSAFDVSMTDVWLGGSRERVSEGSFRAALSRLCDETFNRGPKLWNEHVNRRELTSAGARARREVIDAMVVRGNIQRLGIEGDGPDASIYESVLRKTGIHREGKASWEFGPPSERGLRHVWKAIEDYCSSAETEPRRIDALFSMLEMPPFGVKRGLTPILLAAVLQFRSDDVSVYYRGSFVPSLGPEMWELLVKQPGDFAVKYFRLDGLRREVFRELEGLVQASDEGAISKAVPVRNATMLRVVRPLIRFATKQNQYARQTKQLSLAAIGVREALLNVREPDELLFLSLPQALSINAVAGDSAPSAKVAASYRRSLQTALGELGGAYERLLERCEVLLHSGLSRKESVRELREDLAFQASYLVGRVLDPSLKRVVLTMTDKKGSDREWLEALVMVIADKPAESWTDEEAVAFELRVADTARRFRNLLSLVHSTSPGIAEPVEALRLSLTRSDGREDHHVVWVDGKSREVINGIVGDVVDRIKSFPDEQKLAVAAAVAEAIFAEKRDDVVGTVAPSESSPSARKRILRSSKG